MADSGVTRVPSLRLPTPKVLADKQLEEETHCMRCSPQEIKVSRHFWIKAPLVRILALMLFLLFLPLTLLIMCLVRLTSPGPAIFRQKRVGKDGEEFFLLKIRSMQQDAECETGPTLCQVNDPRVTTLGRTLRFLHLDELPQLVNVIRGEMGLVGPRPERAEIILEHQLEQRVPGFRDRTKVLPGITGLAQINLPADLSADCVIPKVQLDLEYIETANLWLDTRILLCTALRMLGVRHGFAVKILKLNRKVTFPDLPQGVATTLPFDVMETSEADSTIHQPSAKGSCDSDLRGASYQIDEVPLLGNNSARKPVVEASLEDSMTIDSTVPNRPR